MRRYSPLLLILVLIGAFALSQAAAAAPPATVAPTLAKPVTLVPRDAASEDEEAEEPEEEEFEFEEEESAEECEADAEEFEFESPAEEKEFEEEVAECEREAKKGKDKSFVTAPEECLVQKAESTITTLPASDRVRLTIRYSNYSPSTVAIGLKLKDHKGSLALEHTTKHLGRGGVLHLTAKLDEAEMERAEKAHEFDVALRAVNTPGYCGNLLEQHLTSQHGTKAHGSRAHGSRVYSSPKES